MTISLPALLCLSFNRGTWREKRNRHVDEDMTESGKPIVSKMPGTPMTVVSGAVRVDRAGKLAWDAFFKTACAEGSLPFEAPDPKTKALQVFRWADTIDWSESGNKFIGAMALLRE